MSMIRPDGAKRVTWMAVSSSPEAFLNSPPQACRNLPPNPGAQDPDFSKDPGWSPRLQRALGTHCASGFARSLACGCPQCPGIPAPEPWALWIWPSMPQANNQPEGPSLTSLKGAAVTATVILPPLEAQIQNPGPMPSAEIAKEEGKPWKGPRELKSLNKISKEEKLAIGREREMA